MDLNVSNYEDLIRLEIQTADNEDLLQLLRENGLVKRKRRCCTRLMNEGTYGKSKMFGRAWRCSVCRTVKHFFVGSFFESSRLHPFTIFKLAYLYLVVGIGANALVKQMRNPPSSTILTDWMQFCRDVLTKDLIYKTKDRKIGGPGKVVIADKTVLNKRNHRGTKVTSENHWILGLYDVDQKVGLLFQIESCSAAAIIPNIEECVEQGTEIVTDEMPAYASLPSRGYLHRTVSRSQFVSEDGCHRNHVKGYFSNLKSFLRKRGVKAPNTIPTYLDEFMWRERHKTDIWGSFLTALKRQRYC